MLTINVRKIVPYILVAFLTLPLFALAQWDQGSVGEIDTFAAELLAFINEIIVPLLFALALVLFIWGAFIYLIYGGADSGNREKGRMYMFWGVIAFVIIVSVWGIVNLVAGGLGFSDREQIDDLIPSAENF